MTGCCVIGCTNSSTKGYKMCRIPTDVNRRKMWLDKINRADWVPGQTAMLCEVSLNHSKILFEQIAHKNW